MVTICNVYNRSRKCQFFRRLLLLQLTSILMVTICTIHVRSRKCHFLRKLLLLQLNPVVMVTTCTEHTRSRKWHFLRRGNLTTKLLFLSWLGDFFFPLQELPCSSLLVKWKLSLLMMRLKLNVWFVVTSAWQKARHFSITQLSIFWGQGHIQPIISLTVHGNIFPLSAELLTVWWFNCNKLTHKHNH